MGLSNFIAATIIAARLSALNLYSDYALIAMLVGFWLMMLMFGTGIRDSWMNQEGQPLDR